MVHLERGASRLQDLHLHGPSGRPEQCMIYFWILKEYIILIIRIHNRFIPLYLRNRVSHNSQWFWCLWTHRESKLFAIYTYSALRTLQVIFMTTCSFTNIHSNIHTLHIGQLNKYLTELWTIQDFGYIRTCWSIQI